MNDMTTWLENAKSLYNIQQERKALEKKEQELSIKLREFSQHEACSYGGMKYFYEMRSGSIEYGAIPEIQHVNLELYRKPAVKVWKLAIESVL